MKVKKNSFPRPDMKKMPKDPLIWRIRLGAFFLSAFSIISIFLGLLILGQNDIIKYGFWIIGVIFSVIGISWWYSVITVSNRVAITGGQMGVGDVITMMSRINSLFFYLTWFHFSKLLRKDPNKMVQQIGRHEACAQALLTVGLICVGVGALFYLGIILF